MRGLNHLIKLIPPQRIEKDATETGDGVSYLFFPQFPLFRDSFHIRLLNTLLEPHGLTVRREIGDATSPDIGIITVKTVLVHGESGSFRIGFPWMFEYTNRRTRRFVTKRIARVRARAVAKRHSGIIFYGRASSIVSRYIPWLLPG